MPVDRSEVRDNLCANELFASLHDDDAALDFLAARCEHRDFTGEQTIMREGEEGHELIVLVTGGVKISKRTPAGEEYAVAVLEATDNPCIGELSLLDAEVRSATVTARADTAVLSLQRDAFQEFADAFPHHATTIYQRLGRLVAQRLRRANDDIVTLFQALVEEVEAQSVGARPHRSR